MACDAERFLSFVPHRREEWKGHETAKNVRNVIRCNAETSGLRLFALVPHAVLTDDDGDRLEGAAYVEIYPPAWDHHFSEEAE